MSNSTEKENVQIELKEISVDDVKSKPTESVVEEKSTKILDFQYDIANRAIVESFVPLIEDFSVENLMKLIPELIKHVEMYKKFTGEQKKAMVISMLNHLVDITDGPGNDELLDPIVKRLVPSIIDTLVEVDKGRLRLSKNKVKRGCLAFFRFLTCRS